MIANKHSQNDTVGRTTNQSWISLPSFILSAIDSQKQRITAKFNKISNHHQYHISAIHLSRCICTYPYFSKPVRSMYQFYQSPSGPVSTYKTLQVFRIYKDCLIWTWKYTSKLLPGKKRLRIHSRMNLRRCICIHCSPQWPQILSTVHGFFTLAANNKPQIIRSKLFR